MNESLEKYTRVFTRLNTDASRARWSAATRHRAPHKPLLLLAVIDLFARRSITSDLIEITPDLGETFTLYWARAMPPDQKGSLALPFFHLKSDGFWQLIPKPGKESFLIAAQQIRSLSQLRDTILGAKLDDELYALMCVEESRNVLQAVLLETYFSPDVQSGLISQSAINAEAFEYSTKLLEQARGEIREGAVEAPYQAAARDQGFRRAITAAYDHRCALCDIRMLTADGHTVVDGAHIIPWSVSHNDDPRNGMGLCRLCHWSFDEGMVAVSARYVVLASPQVSANRNIPGQVLTLAGRGIIGPVEEPLWPDIDALAWHRQNVFRAR